MADYRDEKQLKNKMLYPGYLAITILSPFLFIIIYLQLYGLPFWKNVPAWSRAIPSAIYIVIVVTAYSFIKDTQGRRFTRLSEIIRIPGIYYFLLAMAWLIIVAITKLQKIYDARTVHSNTGSQKSIVISKTALERPPLWKEMVFISASILTYVMSVFLSWILEYLDLPVDLIVLTVIYSASFMLLSAIGGSFFLKPVLPMNRHAASD